MVTETAITPAPPLHAAVVASSCLTFTIFFDDPFWIGFLEVAEETTLGVARYIFGAEPTPPEVSDFAAHGFVALLREATVAPVRFNEQASAGAGPRNPKRAMREAAAASGERGLSTKAQEALRCQLESRKIERRVESRAEREAFAARKRELRRAKAKAKHRGH